MSAMQPAAPATPPRHRSVSAPAMAGSPLSKTTSVGSEDVAETAMVKAGSTLWAAEGAAGVQGADRVEEADGSAARRTGWDAGEAISGGLTSAAASVRAAAGSVASTAAEAERRAQDAAKVAADRARAAASGVRHALHSAAAQAAEEVKHAASEVRTNLISHSLTNCYMPLPQPAVKAAEGLVGKAIVRWHRTL